MFTELKRVKMKTYSVLIIIVSTLLLSCTTITVKTDFDLGQDFSKYKTYRFTGKKIPGDALEENQLLKNRVISSIERSLKEKGFVQENATEVDFIVVAHAGIKGQMQETNWGGTHGYGWYDPWYGAGGGRTDVTYYEQGTLIIDIVNAEKKVLVWRGLAQGIVKTYSDPEEQQENLNDTVAEILSTFPPNSQ